MKNLKLKFINKTSNNSKIFFGNIFNMIKCYIEGAQNIKDEMLKEKAHEDVDKKVSALVYMYPELLHIYEIKGKAFNKNLFTLADYFCYYGYDNALSHALYDIDSLKVKSMTGDPVLKLFLNGINHRDITQKLVPLNLALKKHPEIALIKDTDGKSIKDWLMQYTNDYKDNDLVNSKLEILSNNKDAFINLKNTISQLEEEKTAQL